MGIDDGSYLPAQSLGNAVELALAVAVLHDLAPAAESAPLRRRRVSPSIGLGQRAARARAARPVLGLPRQVVPQPRGLLVSKTVLAISDVGPLQVRHEGPALQQPGLWILNAPEARAQVPDELQSSDGRAVALLELAGPARQGATVLGAGRRGPDHVKVAGREHGHRLPAAHIGADGGAGLGVKIKADHLPQVISPGQACALIKFVPPPVVRAANCARMASMARRARQTAGPRSRSRDRRGGRPAARVRRPRSLAWGAAAVPWQSPMRPGAPSDNLQPGKPRWPHLLRLSGHL